MTRDEEAARKIQVRLQQTADLPLAEPRRDRRREHDALIDFQLQEERKHLFGLQDIDDALEDTPRLDLLGRIRPEPLARPLRLVERNDEKLPNVVDGPRREIPILQLKQLLDVAWDDVFEALRREPRLDNVPPHRSHVPRVRLLVNAVRVEPPGHQIRDGPALRVERQGNEAETLPLCLQFFLLHLCLGLSLRLGLGRDRLPATAPVLVLESPTLLVRVDGSHDPAFRCSCG
ncbi:MAG TPA: hypothetical protein VMK12_31870 [Anaeromyxobacteraceae bacterium]|nr:hypothetical protein [Anaeromyxobacteraceae bacterium]